MTTLLLIRHALTDWVASGKLAGWTPGIPLNAQGRQQAAELAERLAKIDLDAIYASPLQRAVETAEAIAARRPGLIIRIRENLGDTRVGEWQGKHFHEVEATEIFKALQTRPSGVRIPGGETIDEVQARIVGELEAMRQAHHPDAVIAIVSHADVIKAAVAHYLGLDINQFQRLAVDPASVTILEISRRGVRLRRFNDSGALPEYRWWTRWIRVFAALPALKKGGHDMAQVTYDLKPVNSITADAVGTPGKRTFYIQARKEDQVVTLLAEKQQVQALALAVEQILEELAKQHPQKTPEPAVPEAALALQEPLIPAFRIGQLGLGYDAERDYLVLVAYEIVEEEGQEPASVARFFATRAQMRALSKHAAAVCAAGRPLCTMCGEPMDPEGHFCPKRNGH